MVWHFCTDQFDKVFEKISSFFLSLKMTSEFCELKKDMEVIYIEGGNPEQRKAQVLDILQTKGLKYPYPVDYIYDIKCFWLSTEKFNTIAVYYEFDTSAIGPVALQEFADWYTNCLGKQHRNNINKYDTIIVTSAYPLEHFEKWADKVTQRIKIK